MLEEFKETLRRVLLAKYSIGFIDGYETGKADGYTEQKRAVLPTGTELVRLMDTGKGMKAE